jgi:hypothetical protein
MAKYETLAVSSIESVSGLFLNAVILMKGMNALTGGVGRREAVQLQQPKLESTN